MRELLFWQTKRAEVLLKLETKSAELRRIQNLLDKAPFNFSARKAGYRITKEVPKKNRKVVKSPITRSLHDIFNDFLGMAKPIIKYYPKSYKQRNIFLLNRLKMQTKSSKLQKEIAALNKTKLNYYQAMIDKLQR